MRERAAVGKSNDSVERKDGVGTSRGSFSNLRQSCQGFPNSSRQDSTYQCQLKKGGYEEGIYADKMMAEHADQSQETLGTVSALVQNDGQCRWERKTRLVVTTLYRRFSKFLLEAVD